MIDTIFRWTRDPPAEWQADLNRLAPPRQGQPYLLLLWEPGTPTSPVQRWVIAESLPGEILPPHKLERIQEGVCICPMAGEVQDDSKYCFRCEKPHSPGRRRLYDFYQRTGLVTEPFWIIQGDRGGHKYHYSMPEAMMARAVGLPDTPPLPGDLAYAPFDGRVLAKLRTLDRLAMDWATLAMAHKQGAKDAEQQARRLVLKAMDGVVEEGVGEYADGLPWDEIPMIPADAPEPDYDAYDEAFIETGHGPKERA